MSERNGYQTETELVRAFQTGCPTANRQLYRQLNHQMLGLAWQILRHTQDMEDAVQNAWYRIWSKRFQFAGRSRFSSWVYRITFNESLQLKRRRRSDVHLADELPADCLVQFHRLDLCDPAILFERHRKYELARAAIERLPTKQRVVVKLVICDEVPIKKTAACYRISTAAVKGRLNKARWALKKNVATPRSW